MEAVAAMLMTDADDHHAVLAHAHDAVPDVVKAWVPVKHSYTNL